MRSLATSLTLVCWACTASAWEVRGASGLDTWYSPDTQVRYLPNYKPAFQFRAADPWVYAQAEKSTALDDGSTVTTTFAGRNSAVAGGYVSRADVDFRTSSGFGVRAGMLPYRVSYCRSLGEGPWLAEPSALCRYYVLNAMAGGGAGVQAYASIQVGDWTVDGMAGLYRPRLDGQSKLTLGPQLATGPHTRDDRAGVSFNALHLSSGLQTRFSVLKADEVQDGKYTMATTTRYLAAQAPVGADADLALSHTRITGGGFIGVQTGIEVNDLTAEVIWKFRTGNTLAVGASTYAQDVSGIGAHLQVKARSIAYRRELGGGWFMVAQASHSASGGYGKPASGTALGFRVAKSF